MDGFVIRDADERDAEAIARIYNHYVATSAVTFDTEPKTAEDRRAWLAAHGERHPVVVAESDGRVIGWGSLSPWHVRPAYDASVEVSSYIDPAHLGKGIGSALMRELIALAEQAGHHVLLSQVVAGNDASIALGERFGYREVGRLPQVGRKFDEWLDVVIMALVLESPVDSGHSDAVGA